MGTEAIDNVACPNAKIVRHDAETDTRAGSGALTDVSDRLRFWLRRRGKVGPRRVGRSIGSQIDSATSPLLHVRCDAVQTF